MPSSAAQRNIRTISYAKYGYMFILPFFLVYAIFQLWPLIYTFTISTYNVKDGVDTFVGVQNFKDLLFASTNRTTKALHEGFIQSIGNTLKIWLVNFLPQIALSLLLAVWFTDSKLKIRGKGFFKVVMYMPNIITASSVAVLFLSLFGETKEAPVNGTLIRMGLVEAPIKFTTDANLKRLMISFIQAWMWYGNTMILLMSGIMGINPSLFEAANIDGANSWQVFTKITVPSLRPILLYTLITSMIGGLQMFDIPLLYNNGTAYDPNTKTIAIFIYERYVGTIKQYGYSGAASLILFVITSILGAIVFYMNRDVDEANKKKQLKKMKKQAKQKNKGLGGFEI
ncbi:MAG: carbohydrate ABC transporter permease [Oscillospiraceae bacterium]